jgi:hypothetical protein
MVLDFLMAHRMLLMPCFHPNSKEILRSRFISFRSFLAGETLAVSMWGTIKIGRKLLVGSEISKDKD